MLAAIPFRIFCLSACYLKKRKIKIYRIIRIILPLVLYGCETLSLTFREENKLRVNKDKALRKKFKERGRNRRLEKNA
jgi:hypothetical protein